MPRFTTDNTEGFTAAELAALNEAFEQLIAEAGMDGEELAAEQFANSVADALNNVWQPGMDAAALVAAYDA